MNLITDYISFSSYRNTHNVNSISRINISSSRGKSSSVTTHSEVGNRVLNVITLLYNDFDILLYDFLRWLWEIKCLTKSLNTCTSIFFAYYVGVTRWLYFGVKIVSPTEDYLGSDNSDETQGNRRTKEEITHQQKEY